MSRKPTIEEFDDDTDLPLPSRPLPNTGPLLQHIDDYDDSGNARAGPASPSIQDNPDAKRRVTDITPYKTWSCIYPIYMDAKRPYHTGSRRIARNKSVWWPLSKDIADACARLGLGTLHEVNKSHPKDWENPGRVRVQWKRNGKVVNPQIKTKKELLLAISFQIQLLKPENTPKPPYNPTSTVVAGANPTPCQQQQQPSSTMQAKGKLPQSAATTTTTSSSYKPSSTTKSTKRRLPTPPEPHPSLTSRVSTYSPAIPTGVLIDTVKAGMNSASSAEGGVGGDGAGVPGAPGSGATQGGKGKRKVIRVRG